MIPGWERTVAAALGALDPAARCTSSISASRSGLPALVPQRCCAPGSRASTSRPRESCARCWNRNASASAQALSLETLYRGYAVQRSRLADAGQLAAIAPPQMFWPMHLPPIARPVRYSAETINRFLTMMGEEGSVLLPAGQFSGDEAASGVSGTDAEPELRNEYRWPGRTRAAAWAVLASARRLVGLLHRRRPHATSPPSSTGVARYPSALFATTIRTNWEGGAPWHYAVHGIDVSKYQGDIDWHKAKTSGVSFAFIKATEGGDRVDDMFDEHWRGAKAAGVPRAPYHFYYFCRPADEQARWFIRNVPKERGACRRCSTWSGTRNRRPASCGPTRRPCAAK